MFYSLKSVYPTTFIIVARFFIEQCLVDTLEECHKLPYFLPVLHWTSKNLFRYQLFSMPNGYNMNVSPHCLWHTSLTNTKLEISTIKDRNMASWIILPYWNKWKENIAQKKRGRKKSSNYHFSSFVLKNSTISLMSKNTI